MFLKNFVNVYKFKCFHRTPPVAAFYKNYPHSIKVTVTIASVILNNQRSKTMCHANVYMEMQFLHVLVLFFWSSEKILQIKWLC